MSWMLGLAIILIAAKIGGGLAARVGQPAVLGELVVGVVLGNVDLAGPRFFEPMTHDAALGLIAELGVLLLLFEVGLESTVRQMLRVGASAFLVALLGVAAPLALGWAAGAALLPAQGTLVHAFLGATLCATSVGITARVLQQLGASQSDEARVILGAAVIDDVLGLVILAVITGIIGAADQGSTLSYVGILVILGKSLGFLVGAIVLGLWLARPAQRGGLGVALAMCFLFAWASEAIGLAPIVGAFAAGLVLEDKKTEEEVRPITGLLVPVFFVLMGMRTELAVFTRPGILFLAAALTLAAIAGKQLCSLGARRGMDRLSVGIGMIPRGEVGLIFAGVGRSVTIAGQPVIADDTFAAVVVMVIVTTMITPPALKWSLSRGRRYRARTASGSPRSSTP